ncbi:RAF-like serine/threonine-protein kinase PRAF [Tasmannia lanceolata]|uniref:RAF-like serine/threonine-protein kinase PRAF n=1 Tax=Tasmannia lanceolata TaxID=3420 RepID=UPI004063BE7F
MVGSPIISDDFTIVSHNTVKFLCSYGGKILPRYPDGKLRYVGGLTRVVSVDKSVPFSELLLKLGELYGSAVSLRCQLPTEDLDALVSITSDEDLINLMEEYDRASRERADPLKIRAFLSSRSKISPPSTPMATAKSPASFAGSQPIPATVRCVHDVSSWPVIFPVRFEKSSSNLCGYARFPTGNPKNSNIYLVHNGNHWQ